MSDRPTHAMLVRADDGLHLLPACTSRECAERTVTFSTGADVLGVVHLYPEPIRGVQFWQATHLGNAPKTAAAIGYAPNWVTDPDVLPDVEEGASAYFWIAVRRGHKGKVYTFPALYCNGVQLMSEHPKDCSGSGWSQVAAGEHEDDWDISVSGWYKAEADESGEYDTTFSPICAEHDIVVGWHPAPTFAAAAAAEAQP